MTDRVRERVVQARESWARMLLMERPHGGLASTRRVHRKQASLLLIIAAVLLGGCSSESKVPASGIPAESATSRHVLSRTSIELRVLSALSDDPRPKGAALFEEGTLRLQIWQGDDPLSDSELERYGRRAECVVGEGIDVIVVPVEGDRPSTSG